MYATHDQKQVRRKVFISSYVLQSVIKGRQGWILEEKLEQRPARWLASSLVFSFLSYTIQDHTSRSGTTHSGLGPPPPTSNPENDPQAHPSGGDNPSAEVPSSQVALACVQLTELTGTPSLGGCPSLPCAPPLKSLFSVWIQDLLFCLPLHQSLLLLSPEEEDF